MVITFLVSHEIQIIGHYRMDHRPQGIHTGVPHWSWGQPLVQIGIVGRFQLQIVISDFFFLGPQDILDGGIGLDGHPHLEPFFKDAGNKRHLLLMGGFPFHHGSQCHDIPQGQIAFVQIAPQIRRQFLVELLDHHGHNVLGCSIFRYIVGGRADEPFRFVDHIRIAGLHIGIRGVIPAGILEGLGCSQVFPFQFQGYFIDGSAFRHSKTVGMDFALG